jgi:hypothetical protein
MTNGSTGCVLNPAYLPKIAGILRQKRKFFQQSVEKME